MHDWRFLHSGLRAHLGCRRPSYVGPWKKTWRCRTCGVTCASATRPLNDGPYVIWRVQVSWDASRRVHSSTSRVRRARSGFRHVRMFTYRRVALSCGEYAVSGILTT